MLETKAHANCLGSEVLTPSLLWYEFISSFLPSLAYHCTNKFALSISCQQLIPGVRTPVCTAGCQRLAQARVNLCLAERDASNCSKANYQSHNFHHWYS